MVMKLLWSVTLGRVRAEAAYFNTLEICSYSMAYQQNRQKTVLRGRNFRFNLSKNHNEAVV